MARKIEKKVISDDLLFGDDFDEGKLARIEAELVRTPISEALEEAQPKAGKATPPAAAGGEAAVTPSDGALDQGMPTGPSSETQDRDLSEKRQAAVAKVVRAKLMLLAAVGFLLLAVTAGVGSLYWFKWRLEAQPPTQFVRHPIVVPSHRHGASFLLFVGPSGKRKDLLKVELELDFSSTQGYEVFKRRQVFFCDAIYRFLRKQEPPENSFEHWEEILQTNLLESLSRNYPETRLSTVRMKGLQRL